MEYFKLKSAIEDQIVGVYPQSIKMTDDYFVRRSDSIWEMDIHSKIPPNLDGIQLVKHARATDLLSVVPISPIFGLVISEEGKEVLQNFNAPPHRFFEVKVYDHQKNETQKNYFLFRLLDFQNESISFERSKFMVSTKEKIQTLAIRTAADLKNLSPELCMDMYPKLISLRSDFQFDIFYFDKIGGYFVSERLKNAVESAGLTGMRFELPEFPILQEDKVTAPN